MIAKILGFHFEVFLTASIIFSSILTNYLLDSLSPLEYSRPVITTPLTNTPKSFTYNSKQQQNELWCSNEDHFMVQGHSMRKTDSPALDPRALLPSILSSNSFNDMHRKLSISPNHLCSPQCYSRRLDFESSLWFWDANPISRWDSTSCHPVPSTQLWVSLRFPLPALQSSGSIQGPCARQASVLCSTPLVLLR